MKRSAQRILTSHAGSLPRPDELIELNRARQAGESRDEAGYQERLRLAVEDVVRRQKAGGHRHRGRRRVRQGHGPARKLRRVVELFVPAARRAGAGRGDLQGAAQRSDPGQVRLTSFPDRRDRQLFPEAYADPDSGCSTVRPGSGGMRLPVCRGPLTYTGGAAIAADIAHFKAGAEGRRRRGRVHDLDRAGQRLADRQRVLQDRGGVHLRVRRGDARGVQSHHRRRAACCSSTTRPSPRTGT